MSQYYEYYPIIHNHASRSVCEEADTAEEEQLFKAVIPLGFGAAELMAEDQSDRWDRNLSWCHAEMVTIRAYAKFYNNGEGPY